MLTRLIIAYLAVNKRLVIPQLGAFLVKEPGREVVFSELMRRDDGVLRGLLEAEGVASVAAAGEIDRLVFEVRHAIQEGREFRLEGFGRLYAGANGTISFVYEPTMQAEPQAEVTVETPMAQPDPVQPDPVQPIEEQPIEEQPVAAPQREAEAAAAEKQELHLSVSPKMRPASHVKGLKYGKPPKNTDAFTYVSKPVRRGGDRFIWVAVVAILLALGAIAFGFYHEWSEEAAFVESPTVEVEQTDSLTSEMLQ